MNRVRHTVEIGSVFGRWTVIGPSDKRNSAGRRAFLSCRCECGVVREVDRSGLTSGASQSCGCLRIERVTTHNASGSDIYGIWASMIYRCTSPSASNYSLYGGRGIGVCQRWLDSFESFADDMGPRPQGMTLDRIDFNGNYGPSNCRWATASEQARNKRDNHILEHDGRSLTVAEWAEITGLARGTIISRLERGWPVARTLTTPKLREGGRRFPTRRLPS